LVTDLPADFEVFGQAVDTSLADLKGGTTGQILSKATNTDMDFTWITNDVGDITAVTAGTGITGGGTSGAVTVSFDQANYGGGQYAAGKNKIINGDFYINQRLFTSATALNTYMFDRWLLKATDGTTTATAQTFTTGTAPVSGYEGKNYLQVASTGQTLTSARSAVCQPIENVRTFAGQTVTVSFWAKASSGTPNISISYDQYFGTGGSPSTIVSANITKTAITTSWVRYSATVTLPSISGKTIGTNNNDFLQILMWTSAGSDYNTVTNSLGIQTTTIQIWGVQVEAGSYATPFQTASGGSPQAELAMCQRYYYRVFPNAAGQILNWGGSYSTIAHRGAINFPVVMRTKPTALETSGIANQYAIGQAGIGTTTCNAVPTFAGTTEYMASMSTTVASGLTTFTPAQLQTDPTNGAPAYLGWSAEL
jgi:hypothetical protein